MINDEEKQLIYNFEIIKAVKSIRKRLNIVGLKEVKDIISNFMDTDEYREGIKKDIQWFIDNPDYSFVIKLRQYASNNGAIQQWHNKKFVGEQTNPSKYTEKYYPTRKF